MTAADPGAALAELLEGRATRGHKDTKVNGR